MKTGILFTISLYLMILQVKAQSVGSSSSSETVLSKVEVKRYSKLPVLEIFDQQDAQFGFRVDSSLMTQDVASLFKLVEQLSELEKKFKKTSFYLTSDNLFDTTISLLLRKGSSAPKELFADAFRISQLVTFDLTKMKRVGENLLAMRASDDSVNFLQARGVDEMEKSRASKAPKMKSMHVGSAPPPPPPAPPSSGSSPSLIIVNKSAKNLYVYVDQAYKGIAYPGRAFQLTSRPGCSEVLAESIDQFRSAKKHCFGVDKSNEWFITN